MTALSDQAERDRFITTSGRNISVIAPAGVGKTHAIVQRILAIARQPEAIAVDRLSRLVVVTYSVRAAQQMQQRARIAIREAGVAPVVQRAFQQTFFGTIHSYCVRILERFGHYLGLPSPVALLKDDKEWWNRFLTQGLQNEPVDEHLQELFHFYAPEKLYALGKEIFPAGEKKVGFIPVLNLQPILRFRLDGLHSSTKRSLGNAQAAVQRWNDAWARGDRFHPLPKCPETKRAEFVELWAATFAPLHEWLRDAALEFGRRVANTYEIFRLEQAVMTYDDQVRLALRLLNHTAVQEELAQERPSVLLDEAQDTDPRQFDVLLRAAGIAPGTEQPDDQSFCIVGDFQQAIYAPRSDLSVYRRIHEDLTVQPRGISSTLEVTFRCDEAIIKFVNRIFPTVLHGEQGQSDFFELQARESAGPGQVARWHCPDEASHAMGGKLKADERARHEAQYLAREIKRLGYAGLGADSWADVAILCPRRNWLVQISRELTALELPVQFHSSDETQSDRTPATWLTALIWIAAHPEDSFEIAGVLREVLGVSDHDMAIFTRKNGERLRLDRSPAETSGTVEDALKILRNAIADASSRPLHRAAQRLVERTQLRERLRSLDEFEVENVDQEIDDLLASIAQQAAGGATLAELAHDLRIGLVQGATAEEEIRDAIQLMTSHKSKGLEWQTVIIPFIFRAIETKTPSFPRLVQAEGGREIVLRDKADYTAHAKTFVTERDRQQLQRLLYVTCTRAKHTLLLIDDDELFQGQMQRGGWSSADLLGFHGHVNRIFWEALPTKIEPRNTARIMERALDTAELEEVPLLRHEVARALEAARRIPRRITPHVLAIHPPAESEPERGLEAREEEAAPRATNPGILYGTWWHEFVQTLRFDEPRTMWERRFTSAQARSPQPERSALEWKTFYASKLAAWLEESGRVVHSEVPFLWREKEEQYLEGIIDLAVFTAEEGTWQVIDWKTNLPGQKSSADLVETYRGQIRAYVQSLEQMLSAQVKGSLYLTSSGDWINVD